MYDMFGHMLFDNVKMTKANATGVIYLSRYNEKIKEKNAWNKHVTHTRTHLNCRPNRQEKITELKEQRKDEWSMSSKN